MRTYGKPSLGKTTAAVASAFAIFTGAAFADHCNEPPVKPGCGYGDTAAHSGPPGIMKKGGFDQDQPANPGGPKECPAAAGGKK